MSLSPGTRVGPYEIAVQIGSGGMGEVYRATDTNLKRQVAIKVLPESLAHDSDRLARFQREAEVLASVSHPNIAIVHGLEKDGGITALVMELVEGPTLADRVALGRVPTDEALPIARQIASALEAAHDRGVIHRDLKPANIKLRSDGSVKVLDFGLAKLVGPAEAGRYVSSAEGGEPADVTQSPTITTPALTNVGVILGTAAYMSPEQAKGQATDKRSDIWAFGCVLFELLAGKRTFDGDGVSDTIAAVLRSEPDWSALPADVPLSIRLLLARCLEKDKRKRITDISTAAFVLDERASLDAASSSPAAKASSAAPAGWRRTGPLVAVGIVVAAVTSLAWWSARTPPFFAPEMRLEIAVPATFDTSFAISPDGQKLVYAVTSQGRSRLWLRPLNESSLRMLAGTEGTGGPLRPFWSPDSRSLGFFADGKLKRIDLDSGLVRSLANVGTAYGGGTWGTQGVIVFAPTAVGPLFQVAATGGEVIQVTKDVSSEQNGHNFPHMLPDGRHFLYSVSGSAEAIGIYVGDLEGADTRRVVNTDSQGLYLPPGWLLFVRGSALMAQSFDAATLQLQDEAIRITDGITVFTPLSVSLTGLISYRSGSASPGLAPGRQFAWVDRNGRELRPVAEKIVTVIGASLSRDGQRLAVDAAIGDLGGGSGGSADIWLIETDRGVRSRLTFHGPPVFDLSPVWSPDGSSIAFGSNLKGIYDLYRKSLTGRGTEEPLLSTPQLKVPSDWSPDGRLLLYETLDPKTATDVWALPLNGGAPFEVVRTPFNESAAQFSPDGRWVAYRSDKSGRFEVYVQPFPLGQGTDRLISTDGGAQPRWSPKGDELFYIALDEQLMAVPIKAAGDGKSLQTGAPRVLFRTHVGGAVRGPAEQQYAVAPDGQRFLMGTITEEPTDTPITMILNWKGT